MSVGEQDAAVRKVQIQMTVEHLLMARKERSQQAALLPDQATDFINAGATGPVYGVSELPPPTLHPNSAAMLLPWNWLYSEERVSAGAVASAAPVKKPWAGQTVERGPCLSCVSIWRPALLMWRSCLPASPPTCTCLPELPVTPGLVGSCAPACLVGVAHMPACLASFAHA